MAHNHEIAGSIPAPGTLRSFDNDKRKRIQMYTITQRNWRGVEATVKQPQERPCFVGNCGTKPAFTTEHDNTNIL